MTTRLPPEVTDDMVIEIMEQLYGQRPLTTQCLSGGPNLSGGVNMYVYAVTFATGPKGRDLGERELQDRVIKLAGQDRWKLWAVLEEQSIMRALRAEGLIEVPEIEYCQDDLGWSPLPFFTMRRIDPGVNIDTSIGPDDDDAEKIWQHTGSVRARFGQMDWQCSRHTSPPRQISEQLLRFIDSVEQAVETLPLYRGVFTELIEVVRELARTPEGFLGQGDTCEVLTCHENGVALVDFSGSVGAHRRLRELGTINGWLSWKHNGDPRIPTWQEQGFFDGETITPAMRQELTIHEIYSLVYNASWLADLDLHDERDSQLAFAKQRLESEKPI